MSQEKKNSTVAQAPMTQSAEAVRNLRPLTSKTDLSDPVFKDGDDGRDDTGLTQILIEIALDGYMVTFSMDDGTEERYVRQDFDEVLLLIRSQH